MLRLRVNHQVASYALFDRTTDKAIMEKKRQDTKYRIAVAEHETNGSMKFITGEDLQTLVSWKNPSEVNLMMRYKSILQKFIREILMS